MGREARLKAQRRLEQADMKARGVEKIVLSPREVVDSVIASSKSVKVSRRGVVNDMADLIARLPLEDAEIVHLYEAICKRMRTSICHVCQKQKPRVEGTLTWPDGDMSKPKKFVCHQCSAESV